MSNIKTTIFLGLLTGLVLFLGYLLGGKGGMFFGLIISFVMNFTSYWFSDKIVLSMYGAKESTPEQIPEIYSMVENLVNKIGIPMPKIYVIDLPTPNAFATGRNESHASVALSRSIISLLSKEELEAVLAHELGHVKSRDILTSTVAGMLAGVVSYLSRVFVFAGNRNRENSGITSLFFVFITPIVATLLHLAVSRSREFAADEFSARITHNSEALVSALQKINNASIRNPLVPTPQNEATAHLFISNPFKPSFLNYLFSTHPSLEARIQKLRNIK